MAANSAIELQRKDLALQVLELMTTGTKCAEACKRVGIEERSFNRTITKFPELTEGIREFYGTRMNQFIEAMTTARASNVESLLKFAESLRTRITTGLLDDDAARMLMRIDAHLSKYVLNPILETGLETKAGERKPDPESRVKADEILKELGARTFKVQREIVRETVEVLPTSEDEIIDLESVETPIQSPAQAPALSDHPDT